MRDVARVELSQQTYSNFAEVSGHPAADILIFLLARGQCPDGRRGGASEAMAEMSKDFPPGLTYASSL